MKRITIVVSLLITITVGLILATTYLFLSHFVPGSTVAKRVIVLEGKIVVVNRKVTEGINIFGYGAYCSDNGIGSFGAWLNREILKDEKYYEVTRCEMGKGLF